MNPTPQPNKPEAEALPSCADLHSAFMHGKIGPIVFSKSMAMVDTDIAKLRYDNATLHAQLEAAKGDKTTALYIAMGCLDYGGGYRSDDGKLECFHHGIQTVINALEAWHKRGLDDTQLAALRNQGIATAGLTGGKAT